MIYLNNIDRVQTVYIPRNEELVGNTPQPCSCELAPLNIIVTADTQNDIRPEMGYDGYYSINIDATDYAQQNFEAGFDDGFEDGYASGSSEGYDIGYGSGYTDGYKEAWGSVEELKSFVITSTTPAQFIFPSSGNASTHSRFDSENNVFYASAEVFEYIGNYFSPYGYYEILKIFDSSDSSKGYIIVAYDTGTMTFYDGEWNGGSVNEILPHGNKSITIGVEDANENFTCERLGGALFSNRVMRKVILNFDIPFSSITATTNGVYGSSANPLTSVTVNVPQSGGSEDFTKLIDRSITDAVIPSGVTKIGSYAFGYCESLSSVTIPNTITEIGNYAFTWNRFSAVTIPNSVTKIGDNVFAYTKLSAVTIPNSVTTLGNNILAYCDSLESVTLPNQITKMPNGTFNSCRSLMSIDIPDLVSEIGSNCFSYCSSLSSITIPNLVTSIGASAFRNCSALTVINILATTAPTISNANAFQGIPSTGTVHYTQGSDYSSWQSNTYLSGWTFVGDL